MEAIESTEHPTGPLRSKSKPNGMATSRPRPGHTISNGLALPAHVRSVQRAQQKHESKVTWLLVLGSNQQVLLGAERLERDQR